MLKLPTPCVEHNVASAVQRKIQSTGGGILLPFPPVFLLEVVKR
jgi:hypothetical protein